MELVIPDGAQVHITVGHPPPLALTYDQRAGAVDPVRSGHQVLRGLGIAMVILIAFEAGRWLPHHASTAAAVTATAPAAAAPAAADPVPATDIPPAFRAQLAQPPRVLPPPGAGIPAQAAPSGAAASPPGARGAANPFGLQE